jgi:cytochrome c oxidase subunit IV
VTAVTDENLDQPPQETAHAGSTATYLTVFAALLGLTLLTVLVSYVKLGEFHTPVALLIAAAKATLVLLFFMHLLHSPRLTWLALGAALLTLGIMMWYTLTDYFTRPWLLQ